MEEGREWREPEYQQVEEGDLNQTTAQQKGSASKAHCDGVHSSGGQVMQNLYEIGDDGILHPDEVSNCGVTASRLWPGHSQRGVEGTERHYSELNFDTHKESIYVSESETLQVRRRTVKLLLSATVLNLASSLYSPPVIKAWLNLISVSLLLAHGFYFCWCFVVFYFHVPFRFSLRCVRCFLQSEIRDLLFKNQAPPSFQRLSSTAGWNN